MSLDDVTRVIRLISIFVTSSRHIALYICLSLCAHTVFNAVKFPIKQFSFVYFAVSVVSQWDKYKIVIETQPFKNT